MDGKGGPREQWNQSLQKAVLESASWTRGLLLGIHILFNFFKFFSQVWYVIVLSQIHSNHVAKSKSKLVRTLEKLPGVEEQPCLSWAIYIKDTLFWPKDLKLNYHLKKDKGALFFFNLSDKEYNIWFWGDGNVQIFDLSAGHIGELIWWKFKSCTLISVCFSTCYSSIKALNSPPSPKKDRNISENTSS